MQDFRDRLRVGTLLGLLICAIYATHYLGIIADRLEILIEMGPTHVHVQGPWPNTVAVGKDR
jgi:hypothetical protein